MARDMGMDLENVRITSAGRRRLLRIVIDADGGVSLDDIALASRGFAATLDGAAAMGEAPYTLEVSSPGVERPLTEPRHWRRAAGRLVTAPLMAPPGPAAAGAAAPSVLPGTVPHGPVPHGPVPHGPVPHGPVLNGRVAGADDDGVILEIDGGPRRFSYAELGPGTIQIEFGRIDAAAAGGTDQGTDEEEPDGH